MLHNKSTFIDFILFLLNNSWPGPVILFICHFLFLKVTPGHISEYLYVTGTNSSSSEHFEVEEAHLDILRTLEKVKKHPKAQQRKAKALSKHHLI